MWMCIHTFLRSSYLSVSPMNHRINVILDDECLEILKQAEKLNRVKTNRSQLIVFAIKRTYQNRIDALRSEAKEHQQRIMEIKDTIKALEEKNG